MTNLFGAYFEQENQQKGNHIAAQMASDPTTPEQAAEFQTLGTELGVPPRVIAGAPEAFRKRADQKRATTALTGAPKLAEWLRNPENRAAANGLAEVENLSWFEQQGWFARNMGRTTRRMYAVPPALSALSKAGLIGDYDATLEELIADEVQKFPRIPGSTEGPSYTGFGSDTLSNAESRLAAVDRHKRGNGGQAMLDFGRTFAELEAEELATALEHQPSPGARGWAKTSAKRKAQARFEAAAEMDGSLRQGLINSAARLLRTADLRVSGASAVPMSDSAQDFIDGPLAETDGSLGAAFGAFARDPIGGAVWLAEVAAESLPTLAAAAAVTYGTRTPAAGIATGAGATYGLESAGEAMAFLAEQKGVDMKTPEGAEAVLLNTELMREARDRGVARGVVIAALEALSGGIGMTRLLKNPVGEVVVQGLVQASLGGIGEAAGQAVLGDELNWTDILAEGAAGLVTAPVEVGFVSGRALKNRLWKDTKPLTLADVLTTINEKVAKSQLKKLAPDKFKSAMASVGLGEESIFVAAQDVEEFFQGPPSDEDLASWDISRDDYDTTLLSGGDLQISLASYAADVSGTEFAGFLATKGVLDPDETPTADVEAFNDQVVEEIVRGFEAELVRAEETAATQEAAAQITDHFRTKFRVAGQSADAADALAIWHTQYWVSLAERMGEDPLELSRAFGLDVQGRAEDNRLRSDFDIQLNMLRSGRLPKPGRTLSQFVKEEGGLRDAGGDLAAIGDMSVIAQSSAELRDGMPTGLKGVDTDEMGRRAALAGFFPDLYEEAGQGNDAVATDFAEVLTDALAEEQSGNVLYEDGVAPDLYFAALQEDLERRGLDISSMTNTEVIAAMEGPAPDADGIEYGQSGELDTDSEAFKVWFGDSEAVDENGAPRVFHHGTNASVYSDGDFQEFNTRQERPGAFFSSSRDVASSYGQAIHSVYLKITKPLVVYAEGKGWASFDGATRVDGMAAAESAAITPEDVALLDELGASLSDFRGVELPDASPAPAPGTLGAAGIFNADIDDLARRARELGFDGLIIKDVKDGPVSDSEQHVADTVVVFDPKQIKSVNNSGAFDRDDPRIMYQSGLRPDADGVEYNRSGELDTDSEAFKKWAGTDAPVIPGDEINDSDFSDTAEGPFVLRVHHGTTHTFEEFDASQKGAKEGHFGALNYFSSSEADAGGNYLDTGPDLQSRVERLEEQVAYEIETMVDAAEAAWAEDPEDAFATLVSDLSQIYDFDSGSVDDMYVAGDPDQGVDGPALASWIASGKLRGGEEQVLDVFIRTERPFVVGGEDVLIDLFDMDSITADAQERVAVSEGISEEELRANLDDYEDQLSEARDDLMAETPSLLSDAVYEVLSRDAYEHLDAAEILAELQDFESDGEVTHTELAQALRQGTRDAEDSDTGDLVGAHILSEVIRELGFDSIILKNADKAFSSMEIEPGTAHVHVFDENASNIKSATGNSGAFDRDDPRILYQSGARPDGALYVVHNLSAEGLAHAAELGGLAAPSIAVAREDFGFDNFGEISLIGAPELADPKQKGVRTFDADVYSPRQPKMRHNLSGSALARMEATLSPAADALQERVEHAADAQALSRDGLDHVAESDVARLAYLTGVGDAPRVRYLPQPVVPPVFRKWKGKKEADIFFDPDFAVAALEHFKARMAEAGVQAKLMASALEADGRLPDHHLRATAAEISHAGRPRRVDSFETGRALRKKIQKTKKRESDYRSWVEAEFGDTLQSSFFLDDGGRKRPYDLPTLVRNMTRSLKGGEGLNYGVGSIRALTANEFKSLTAISKARGRIVSSEDFDATKDPSFSGFAALADKFARFHHGGADFGWMGIFSEFLGDLHKGHLQEWQTSIFDEPAPDALISEARVFLADLASAPTSYFETKMQREVGLSEFHSALVPKKADKATVDLLKAQGLKLVRYDGTPEGRKAALAKLDDNLFFQGNRGSIKFPSGGFLSGAAIITLFETANMSTLLHESGHFFFETFRILASHPLAPAEMKADLAAIYKFVGAEENAGRFTVEQHEMLARATEAYLYEGKAPSLELANAFARFKSWLMGVYKSILRLDVELNDDIRQVMDRMFATEAQLANAQEDLGLRPLFTTPQQTGMSPADFKIYQRIARNSQQESDRRLLKKTMRKVTRERTEWFKAERAEMRKIVEAEVNAQPVYRLTELLGSQNWIGEEGVVVPDFQIDKGELIYQFGDGVIEEIGRSRIGGKRAIYVDGGESPEVVARWFGFDGAPSMVSALQNAGKRKEQITAETDRRMTERHGDPLTDGSIETEAARALHNEQRARLVATEARVLAKDLGLDPRGYTAKEFKIRARRMFGGMSARQAAGSSQFLRAERKHAREAERALAKISRGGEGAEVAMAAALEAKRRQLLNQQLYSESLIFAENLAKQREKLRGYSKAKVRAKLTGGYIEQIDTLLADFDFRVRSAADVGRSETLREFIDTMESRGLGENLAISPWLLDASLRKHYTRLTVDEITGLFDAVASLDHAGRNERKLIDAQRKRDLDETVARVTAQLTFELGTDKAGQTSRIRNTFNLLATADTILLNLDSGEEIGPLYEELKQDIDLGQAEEQKMQVQLAKDLAALYAEHYTHGEIASFSRDRNVDGANGHLWSKSKILTLAMHQGTEANKARVLEETAAAQHRLDEAQVAALLDTLDARDWAFVQAHLDLIDSFWAQLSEVSERRTGVRPKREEPTPIVTKFGTFKGGYSPIDYDPALSAGANLDEKSAWDEYQSAGRGAGARVRSGMTITRQAGSGGRTLSYDLSAPISSLRDTIRLITLSEVVDNARRVLNDKRVADAFLAGGRKGDLDVLHLWLKDTAQGPIANTDVVNSLARMLKNNFTLSRLAFNPKTVLLQTTGFAQSAAVVGKRELLKAYLAYRKRPLELADEVTALSAFMSERRSSFQKDLMDITNDLQISSPLSSRWQKVKQAIARAGMAPLVGFQFWSVDMPTWLAGYAVGVRKYGEGPKAVAYADRMVARAQDSGLLADRSAVERGTLSATTRQSDVVRLFTVLAGYMIKKANRIQVSGLQGSRAFQRAETPAQKLAAVLNLAINLTLLIAVEGTLMAGLAYYTADEEVEEEEVMKFIAIEAGMSVIGGVPVAREIASAFRGYGGGGVLGGTLELPSRAFRQAVQGENDRALRSAIADTAGAATGLPSTMAMRIIEYLLNDDVPLAELFLGKNPLVK
jgi:hypothetical protein